MKSEEIDEFPFTTLLLVTGFCFLTFAIGLRILDGVSIKFFLWFGFITFGSGILTGVYSGYKKKHAIKILKHKRPAL